MPSLGPVRDGAPAGRQAQVAAASAVELGLVGCGLKAWPATRVPGIGPGAGRSRGGVGVERLEAGPAGLGLLNAADVRLPVDLRALELGAQQVLAIMASTSCCRAVDSITVAPR